MSPARRLSDRHPFEIYLLTWALVAVAPSAVGFVEVPASIAHQLPGWWARAWAVGLTVGCVTALTGLAWRRPRFPLVSPTALGMEQVGLTIVGVSTLLYGASLLVTVGSSGMFAAGIQIGFGLACFAQVWKIQQVLRQSRPIQ